jgi:hypothetical protein
VGPVLLPLSYTGMERASCRNRTGPRPAYKAGSTNQVDYDAPLAEEVGFEPTTGVLPVRRFQRRVRDQPAPPYAPAAGLEPAEASATGLTVRPATKLRSTREWQRGRDSNPHMSWVKARRLFLFVHRAMVSRDGFEPPASAVSRRRPTSWAIGTGAGVGVEPT